MSNEFDVIPMAVFEEMVSLCGLTVAGVEFTQVDSISGWTPFRHVTCFENEGKNTMDAFMVCTKGTELVKTLC